MSESTRRFARVKNHLIKCTVTVIHAIQGCCGQLTIIQVERFNGNLPPIQAFEPPVAVKWPEAAE